MMKWLVLIRRGVDLFVGRVISMNSRRISANGFFESIGEMWRSMLSRDNVAMLVPHMVSVSISRLDDTSTANL